MIIIEGPDGAGKTTLVQWIKKEPGLTVMKPYYPKVNQLSYYLRTPAYYAGYFLERYYLSELAYPQFKPDRVVMEPWKQFQIEAALMPFGPVIFYLRPSKETIIKNIKSRGDDYVDEHDVDKMLEVYDGLIERSFIPHVKYDFENDDVEKKVTEAAELYIGREYQANRLRHNLYTGSVEKDGIMIVGYEPSNKSIGCGYIQGFLSDKGSSSFLHEMLYKAGVYEHTMPYFTNFWKGHDNMKDAVDALVEEINEIHPRKILALGRDVATYAPMGEFLEHPSYVKRFNSNNYDWYIDKIKELTK
jgi:deoxyadenosine/deoxycytidine kinase